MSEEKGELAHGCLTCHYAPWVDKIKSLEARLKEAEEVLGFYADEKSWESDEYSSYKELINSSDIENNFKLNRGYVGGKRARKYQNKWSGK